MHIVKQIQEQKTRVAQVNTMIANEMDIDERDYLEEVLWREEMELSFLEEEYAPIKAQIEYMWAEHEEEKKLEARGMYK